MQIGEREWSEPQTGSQTSASLLSGMRHGDTNARERFHEKYAPRMYGWCRRLWRLSHHDAEDLTADLTVKLMVQLEAFHYDPERGNFRGWLRVVAKNAVMDFMRANARRRIEPGVCLEQLTTEDDLVERVDNDLMMVEAMGRVEAKANPMHWNMFIMMVEKGKSPVEVAKEFGVKRNVVDNAKLRMKKALADEIEHLQ